MPKSLKLLPELLRPHHLVADDRGVVHQYVDPALLSFHLIEECLYLVVVGMVHADGDPLAAGRGHQLGSFMDRARE